MIYYYINERNKLEGCLSSSDNREIPTLIMNKQMPMLSYSMNDLLIRRDSGRYPIEQLEEII